MLVSDRKTRADEAAARRTHASASGFRALSDNSRPRGGLAAFVAASTLGKPSARSTLTAVRISRPKGGGLGNPTLAARQHQRQPCPKKPPVNCDLAVRRQAASRVTGSAMYELIIPTQS
jgi:hypothetical protein